MRPIRLTTSLVRSLRRASSARTPDVLIAASPPIQQSTRLVLLMEITSKRQLTDIGLKIHMLLESLEILQYVP